VVRPIGTLEVRLEADPQTVGRVLIAAPVHLCGAIHQQMLGCIRLLETYGYGLDLHEVVLLAPELPQRLLQLIWRKSIQAKLEGHAGITAKHSLGVKRCSCSDACGCVDLDQGLSDGHGRRWRHHTDEGCVPRRQWQAPPVVRDG